VKEKKKEGKKEKKKKRMKEKKKGKLPFTAKGIIFMLDHASFPSLLLLGFIVFSGIEQEFFFH